jgi:farnesyl-diphosphate farnesyltransferase
MKTPELPAPLLRSVSRSFYLSIAVLPACLRKPVGTAYLLARASDTIADTAEAPAATRLEALRLFRRMIATGEALPLPEGIRSQHAGEQELLRELPVCIALLQSLDTADRADVLEVLGHITRGQEMDITRAGSMETAAQLDEYTFLVAGCVGAFWTRVCARHLRRFARLDGGEMERLGVNFGKGLQLVNILRDLPNDLAAGRCYLPGGSERSVDEWLNTAERRLDDAFRYIESLRSARLRAACILPWWLGLRTLALMRSHPPLRTTRRVKVPRSEVRRMLLVVLLPAFSNGLLRRVRENPGFLLARAG